MMIYAKDLPIDNFYYLIEEWVVENADYFMNEPKFTLEAFKNYYINYGFSNKLQAHNWDNVL